MKEINYITPLIATIGGFLTGLVLEPLKGRIWVARLKLLFTNDKDRLRGLYIFETPETQDVKHHKIKYKNCYVRVKVKNTSRFTAKNCLAYLTKIEYDNYKTRRVLLEEYLLLQWSYIGYKAINIPPDTEVFIALVTVDPYYRRLIPQTELKPLLYEEDLKQEGRYRFSFKVVGDLIQAVKIDICVEVSRNAKGRLELIDAKVCDDDVI